MLTKTPSIKRRRNTRVFMRSGFGGLTWFLTMSARPFVRLSILLVSRQLGFYFNSDVTFLTQSSNVALSSIVGVGRDYASLESSYNSDVI